MKLNLVVFALFAIVALSFAGVSVNNYTVSKSTFRSQDTGVITVTVTNPTGSNQVTGLTLSIQVPPEIILTASPKLADIESGGTAIVSIPIKIKSDAKPGVYLLNAVFTGSTSSSSSSSTNTISVPITIVNPPIISISTDTTVLSGIDSIGLTIKNNGGSAKNARLSFSGNVLLYGSNDVYLGDIDNSTKTTVLLDSRNATDGPQDITASLTYNDEIGLSHTDAYTIRVTVKKQKLDIIFIQNSSLVTRKESNLTLAITNNGNIDLKDIRLTFSDSSIRLKNLNEIKFGDIKSGETKQVAFLIFADLAPGLNIVSSKIKWVEKDVEKEQAITVPLTITSDSDVSVYLESKPTPLTSGAEHTISVLVSNVGSYGIDNVDVVFYSEYIQSLDVSSGQYIGSLDSDDFSTVQFKVKINNLAAGSYPVTTNVTYRDKSGEWKAKSIVRSVNISASKSDGLGAMLFLPVLIVIGLVVWYFRFRKKPKS